MIGAVHFMVKKVLLLGFLFVIMTSTLTFSNSFSNVYGHEMVPLRSLTEELGIDLHYDTLKKIIYLDNGMIFDLTHNFAFIDGEWFEAYPFVQADSGVTYISGYWASQLFGMHAFYSPIKKPFFIAHAGGQYDGVFLSNSKEAIEQSLAAGIEYIEVDFLTTTDDHWVLIHHWPVLKRWGVDVSSAISHHEFKNLQIPNGMTLLDLEDLVSLMDQHQQMVVVTDTKGDNVALITHIANYYPHMMPRFRVQVYDEPEYHLAVSLGFEDIILTLYKVYHTNTEVINFAKKNPLFAVTMPTYKVRSSLAKNLSLMGVPTYTHTINTREEMIEYLELGVSGFYTDVLYYFQKAY